MKRQVLLIFFLIVACLKTFGQIGLPDKEIKQLLKKDDDINNWNTPADAWGSSKNAAACVGKIFRAEHICVKQVKILRDKKNPLNVYKMLSVTDKGDSVTHLTIIAKAGTDYQHLNYVNNRCDLWVMGVVILYKGAPAILVNERNLGSYEQVETANPHYGP